MAESQRSDLLRRESAVMLVPAMSRFRPDSLVIKGFTFSVLARPSFHRIDFLLLLKRYAEKCFCADG